MPSRVNNMNLLSKMIAILALCSCSTTRSPGRNDIIGMDSFALAARYGTPASYQIQGEYLQLNYGSTAADCRLIILIDRAQRVAAWASTGQACSVR